MPDFDLDLFVIGGGSAGVRCARIAAGHGARVAIAEERFWGGTCVNVGCVPKKIMVQAAEYGAWARDAEAFGWTATAPEFDLARLKASRDAEIARLSGIYRTMLEGAGARWIEGRATLDGPNAVLVNGERITAANIVIATGGQAVRPDLPGAEHAMLSDDVFGMDRVPRRLAVCGAGYIALEFACIFAGLGSQVELIYRTDLPLRGFDIDIRHALVEALDAQGIHRHADRALARIDRAGEGYVLSRINGGSVEADAVLFALGRRPHTSGLGLESAGVVCNANGAIEIDDDHRTTAPSVFAIGDVTDKLNLTPMATAVGHALADTLFGGKPRRASYDNVATAVFTSPPIATCGMTEADAAMHGPVDIYVGRFTAMRHVMTKRPGRRSVMKLVVDQRTQRVLGAHMLGEDSPEIMQGIAIAIGMGATKQDFDRTIGIHPTVAEEFVTLRTRTRESGIA